MHHFMQEAIKEAARGFPQAFPNPLVGCVIVYENKIVARGYHQKYGQAHAEVNAIAALPQDINPAECTLYVTLEPCSHFGKTPPCANLIIDKGFKKVVIAMKDPNPLVSGRGIALLEAAGITVECGVEEEEARALNPRFLTFHEKKRPFITLKWAQTADGFISRLPLPTRREENLVTGKEVQLLTHQLRARAQAILVGKNTVLADNPSLTVRLTEGLSPLRIILDSNLEVPKNLNVFSDGGSTLVINSIKSEKQGSVEYLKIEQGPNFIDTLFRELHARGVQSLLVEGGTKVLTRFLKEGLWDEIFVYKNPSLEFKTGISAPDINLPEKGEKIGLDEVFYRQNFKKSSFLSSF